MNEEEPKILKDLNIAPVFVEWLRNLAITHIKHLRREGRDLYNANIDEKSAIPWIMKFFGISDEDLK